jgi:low temperature requirement protein LtrA
MPSPWPVFIRPEKIDQMDLDVTSTLFIVGLIWFATVILAFQSARLSPEEKPRRGLDFLGMIVLVLLAAALAADTWYVDFL